MQLSLAFAVLLSLTLLTGCQPASRGSLIRPGQPGAPLALPTDDAAFQGNWPAYGNDAGGTRYSPLTQIAPGNVGQLRVAWIYRTGEADDTSRARRKAAFEATPIVVDGQLPIPAAQAPLRLPGDRLDLGGSFSRRS